MTVSKETVSHIVKTMIEADKEFTTVALTRVTGYSTPTIRQAISSAIFQGSVYKVAGSYPAKFKAITNKPTAGEVLVIKEPVPDIAISSETTEQIRGLLSKPLEELKDNSITHRIAKYYLTSESASRRVAFKDFLINFAEVIKQDLENNSKLSIDDIKVSK